MGRRRPGILLAVIALSRGSLGPVWSEPNESAPPSPRLIGIASMKPYGTIVLDLHGGSEAHDALGVIQYPPGHKDYAAVLRHLGGLRPGERKPVPAWPDQP